MALVGVEDRTAKRMQLLALVQLPADPRSQFLVGKPVEHEVGLHEPSVLLQRLGERVAAAAGLQPGEQQRRWRPPVSQGGGEPEQLVPVWGDDLRADLVLVLRP